MNKRVIVTSMALVLAMTVVLAVGKTGRTDEPDASAHINISEAAAVPARRTIQSGSVLQAGNGQPASRSRAVMIDAKINQEQMILGRELDTQDAASREESGTASDLMVSLQRVQDALQVLEQLAADTETRVSRLEQQVANR